MSDNDFRVSPVQADNMSHLKTRAQAIDAFHLLERTVQSQRAFDGPGTVSPEARWQTGLLLKALGDNKPLTADETERAEFALQEMLRGREANHLWARVFDPVLFRAWRENWTENPRVEDSELAWVDTAGYPDMPTLPMLRRETPAARSPRPSREDVRKSMVALSEHIANPPSGASKRADKRWRREFEEKTRATLDNLLHINVITPGEAARGDRIAAALLNFESVPDVWAKVVDPVEFETWMTDRAQRREGRFIDAPGLQIVWANSSDPQIASVVRTRHELGRQLNRLSREVVSVMNGPWRDDWERMGYTRGDHLAQTAEASMVAIRYRNLLTAEQSQRGERVVAALVSGDEELAADPDRAMRFITEADDTEYRQWLSSRVAAYEEQGVQDFEMRMAARENRLAGLDLEDEVALLGGVQAEYTPPPAFSDAPDLRPLEYMGYRVIPSWTREQVHEAFQRMVERAQHGPRSVEEQDFNSWRYEVHELAEPVIAAIRDGVLGDPDAADRAERVVAAVVELDPALIGQSPVYAAWDAVGNEAAYQDWLVNREPQEVVEDGSDWEESDSADSVRAENAWGDAIQVLRASQLSAVTDRPLTDAETREAAVWTQRAIDQALAAGLSNDEVQYQLSNAESWSRFGVEIYSRVNGAETLEARGLHPDEVDAAEWAERILREGAWEPWGEVRATVTDRREGTQVFSTTGFEVETLQAVGLWRDEVTTAQEAAMAAWDEQQRAEAAEDVEYYRELRKQEDEREQRQREYEAEFAEPDWDQVEAAAQLLRKRQVERDTFYADADPAGRRQLDAGVERAVDAARDAGMTQGMVNEELTHAQQNSVYTATITRQREGFPAEQHAQTVHPGAMEAASWLSGAMLKVDPSEQTSFVADARHRDLPAPTFEARGDRDHVLNATTEWLQRLAFPRPEADQQIQWQELPEEVFFGPTPETPVSSSDVEQLRKRVKELEAQVAELKEQNQTLARQQRAEYPRFEGPGPAVYGAPDGRGSNGGSLGADERAQQAAAIACRAHPTSAALGASTPHSQSGSPLHNPVTVDQAPAMEAGQ